MHGWVCSLYYDRSPQNVPRHFPFGTPDKTSVQSDYIYRHHQHLRGTLPYSNLCSHPLNIPSSSVRMHHSCMGHFSKIHWKQHNNTVDSSMLSVHWNKQVSHFDGLYQKPLFCWIAATHRSSTMRDQNVAQNTLSCCRTWFLGYAKATKPNCVLFGTPHLFWLLIGKIQTRRVLLCCFLVWKTHIPKDMNTTRITHLWPISTHD